MLWSSHNFGQNLWPKLWPLHSRGNPDPILSSQNMTTRFLTFFISTNIITILANFHDIIIQFFWKSLLMTMATLASSKSWLTETPREFEPLISSLTTISRIPIQLRNSPAFAFVTLFSLTFGIFSLSTMVMSIFWYPNTWIWSILLLCNS